MTAAIDFETVRATADLRAIIEAALGPPLRHGRWACPIHGGEGPNLGITPDGRHWRCWSCGERGDATDFVACIEGIPLAEAARRLGAPEQPRGKPPRTRSERPAAPRSSDPSTPARGPATGSDKPLPAWADP